MFNTCCRYVIGLVACAVVNIGSAQTITTVAGGGFVGEIDARSTNISSPRAVAIDGAGNLYIAPVGQSRIFRLAPNGMLTTFVGTGFYESSGDGGLASAAQTTGAMALALDASGNLFFSEGAKVRRVDAISGIVTTVAGTGTYGFSGDGGPATAAKFNTIQGLAIDAAGDLFISDSENHRIRKVLATTNHVITIAGTGVAGFTNDGWPATTARLNEPGTMTLDGGGNIWFSDRGNYRIRRINTAGTIETVAGNGNPLDSGGDGMLATGVGIVATGLAFDANGELYIATNYRVRRLSVHGYVYRVAGTGSDVDWDNTGASGLALDTAMNPTGVAVNAAGELYIADRKFHRVWRVSGTSIAPIAGNGEPFFSGDGGKAIRATLNTPHGVAVDAAGNVYIADTPNARVRRVDAQSGIITTVAGTGAHGYSGDGGPATSAKLNQPRSVVTDGAGNLYIADTNNNRVRKVSAETGLISTVAGNGAACYAYAADDLLASAICLRMVNDVALDGVGNLYVAEGKLVRRVSASSGLISTVAGNRAAYLRFSGDTRLATNAGIYSIAIEVDSAGNLYLLNYDNEASTASTYRVRKVTAIDGLINTVAGGGPEYGDNVLATSVVLMSPQDIVVDTSGNFYLSESGWRIVRKVDVASGRISTVAGSQGMSGFAGDGGPATAARFSGLGGMALDTNGSLFVADSGNNRVRKITNLVVAPDTTPPVITHDVTGTMGNAGWYRSNVLVTWTVGDAESTVASMTGCSNQSVTYDTAGATFTCSAASAGGSASGSVTIKRDATPPVIVLTSPGDSAQYLLNSGALADYSCSDAMAGLLDCAAPVPSGTSIDTSSVGIKTFTVRASDYAGNSAATTHSYQLRYGFVGFFQPVDNVPVLNLVTAGRTVPIKWRLLDGSGDFLTDVGSVASLKSVAVGCTIGAPLDDVEELASAGGTALRYDSAASQFIFNWATSSSWKGKCQNLTVDFADGQRQQAMFKFK